MATVYFREGTILYTGHGDAWSTGQNVPIDMQCVVVQDVARCGYFFALVCTM